MLPVPGVNDADGTVLTNQPSAATTRTRTHPGPARPRRPRLLGPEQVVTSPETGLRYRVERPARRGRVRPGLPRPAARAGRRSCRPSSASRPASASTAGCARPTSASSSTATRAPSACYDAFPLLAPGRPRALLPGARIRDQGRPARVPPAHGQGMAGGHGAAARSRASCRCWASSTAGQLLHRDLTPLNVFVCEGRCLKLGRLRHRAPAERPCAASPRAP